MAGQNFRCLCDLARTWVQRRKKSPVISGVRPLISHPEETKYRNSEKKLIRLDSGEQYEFLWCGMKKRREAGVEIIIRVDSEISYKEPDILDPRILAIVMIVHVFIFRVINA